jgi:protein ImuB
MFAVAFIPQFSLQAVLRGDASLRDRPVALVDPALPKANILQLTAAARSRGVTEGLTPSQAMARCAELQIQARSLVHEQIAIDALLQTAYAFAPNIESTLPGVCTLELKGLGLTWAGEERETKSSGCRWADQLQHALASLDLDVRIGVASTPALALLAASEGSLPGSGLRVMEDSAEFLSELPVTALNPTPEILGILKRWGIGTVGALLKLDSVALSERLGPEVVTLLKQVSPHNRRPLKLVMPSQVYEEEIEFEHEIETAEPLLFVLRRFVEQIMKRLEIVHLVVAEIQLRLQLNSGQVCEQSFRIPAATGNVDTLFRMLQTHLETFRTDAPITGLRLAAKPCLPDIHQFGLFETTLKNPNQFAETMARLTALCGSDRVGTPVLEATHQPDRFHMKPPEFEGASAGRNAVKDPAIAGVSPPGLALRRLRPPLAAHLEFRQQRPALVRSALVNGPIVEARGPFVSSGDWWDRNDWAREEWDVQAGDGVIYRVCRCPQVMANDSWFIEGVYD